MKSKSWFKGNVYWVLLIRLLVVLGLLFTSRLLIYFFNTSLFSELKTGHFWYIAFTGLRFDLFTLIVLNSPVILINAIPQPYKYTRIFQRISNILFYILNTIALFGNFLDIIYFRYSQKRLTFDIFNYAKENNEEILTLLPDYIRDFWPVILIWIVFIVIMVWICNKIKVDYTRYNVYKVKSYLIDFGRLVLVVILVLIIGRGGFQDKPFNIVNAGEYTQPRYFPIILNTPYTLIKTRNKTGITEKNYFQNEQDLTEIFTPYRISINTEEDFKDLNIVVIIVESLTAENSAYLNSDLNVDNYSGYTPFLDSLMKESLTIKGFANGEKSMDCLPAIFSGIPSMMNSSYLVSPFVGNDIPSIAELLKEKGYNSSFYHGGTNGTMGFESFVRMAGFDNYYGRYEYDNEDDYDGKWGIFDEEFLQYMALQLDETPQPFLAAVYTLSSHHPYTIPEKYQGKFPVGPLDIHETMGYTDYAIKKFFETVSSMSWFENTLFVITADHAIPGQFPSYKTSVGRYTIPIVFYYPGSDWSTISDLTVQQTDITPSILDFINYDGEYFAFGQSVFDSTANRFAISYLPTTYQLIKNDYVLMFDGQKDLTLFNFKSDPILSNNLIESEDSIRTEMNTLVKAIVQQFNNRMIRNQLKVK